MEDPVVPVPGARLNGWKEVGTHFGRTVRTVQRWERELGLPVHRLVTGKGETVYALVDELDAWFAASERALSPPDPARPPDPPEDSQLAPAPQPTEAVPSGQALVRRWALLAGGLLVVVIAAVLLDWMTGAWGGGIGGANRRIPSTYRRVGRVLTVLDQAGEVLWHRTMQFELDEQRYARDRLLTPVIFQDLDGDGRTEVLFTTIGVRPADSVLQVFEESGEPRFAWRYGGTKRFGDTSYAAPWAVMNVIVRRPAGGAPEIWVVVAHVPWFPSALVRLDARGRVTGEFWHPGHIATVALATLGGREVLIAGGANNSSKCGFLAVVDPAASSTGPALRDDYTCRDCPAGRPLRYLLFPRTTVSRELDAQAWVYEINQDAAGRVFVAVEHLGFAAPGQAEPMTAAAYYTLDGRLEPVSAEQSAAYVRSYRELQMGGQLKRPFDKAVDERELWPIREWSGSAFVPLPAPR